MHREKERKKKRIIMNKRRAESEVHTQVDINQKQDKTKEEEKGDIGPNQRIYRVDKVAPLISKDPIPALELFEHQGNIINISGDKVWCAGPMTWPDGLQVGTRCVMVPACPMHEMHLHLDVVPLQLHEFGVLGIQPGPGVDGSVPSLHTMPVQKPVKIRIHEDWRGRMLLVNHIQWMSIIACSANHLSGCTLLLPSARAILPDNIPVVTGFWIHEFPKTLEMQMQDLALAVAKETHW